MDQGTANSEVVTNSVKCNGIYIEGKVNCIPALFTVDTGASRTIVSKAVYDNIHEERRPLLNPLSKRLIGASGRPITVHGKVVLSLCLYNVVVEREVYVADIHDEVLLGIDIIQNDRTGPADLSLSTGTLTFSGQQIPLIQVGKPSIPRLCSLRRCTVPGHSETVLEVVRKDSNTDPNKVCGLAMIEPAAEFCSRYPLAMTCSLVDFKKNITGMVRVMNPYPDDVVIEQDAFVGTYTLVEENDVEILIEQEDEQGCENFDAVREIQLRPTPTLSKHIVGDKLEVPLHLTELFNDASEGHDMEHRAVISSVLNDDAGIFSTHEDDLGLTHLGKHHIDTGDAKPIKLPPRRPPIALRGEEEKAVQKLLKQKVIRKSNSPWAAPVVLVKKKNGSIRPCVDYRQLNAVTRKDAYPLPRISECLDTLSNSAIFSTLDMLSGYNQVPICEEDIPKSAFVVRSGLYEYVTMPFGMSNSPATFQRIMELAMQGLTWTTCLVYLDDIIVFGSTFEEHTSRLLEVFSRIRNANLKLKPSKCKLFKSSVTFLGFFLSKDGIKPDPSNIEKIANWPVPENPTHVRQFMGLCSYYRRFVKEFSRISAPLFSLTHVEVIFEWSDDAQKAFETLKQKLMGPEIMAYPQDNKLFILDTDACDVSIGAVLSQVHDRERVVAYGSRTLNKSERNYCVTDKELLAVRHFVEYFRHYLLGRTFLVRTDHQALVWLFSLKEPKSRTARWIEILSAYDFQIEYRPGPRHGNADALSRCPNPRDCQCPDVDTLENLPCGPCHKCRKRSESMDSTLIKQGCRQICTRSDTKSLPWFTGYTSIQLRNLQEADPVLQVVLSWIREGKKPEAKEVCSLNPEIRHFWCLWNSLVIDEGLLFKKCTTTDSLQEYRQLVVPESLRTEIMFHMHDTQLSGHLGAKKTKRKLLQRFYWFQARQDVYQYVATCDICSSNRKPPKSARAPLGDMRVGAPLDRIGVDVIGPLPCTESGNRYILVITDHFTKWVEAFPMKDQTASSCARLVVNEVISRFGCPLDLHSDQGRNFESDIFKELCRLLHIRKTRSSPRHPQGNGQTERFNRTLVNMIRSYIADQQDKWDENLGCLTGAYRATVNDSTQMTPNMLMLGREVRVPLEAVITPKELDSQGTYVTELKKRLKRAHEIVRQNLKRSAMRQKAYYDVKATLNSFKTGDLVWYLNEVRKVGLCEKLQALYIGPVLVISPKGPRDYVIQLDKQGTRKLVHQDKLKLYNGPKSLPWAKKALGRK